MTMGRWHRRAPPWWPAGEPWPPAGGWHRKRGRYFRRAGGVALAILTLSLWGLLSLGRLLVTSLGLTESSSTLLVIAAAVVGVAVVFAAFRAMIRSFARPLEEIVDAAERVANGDYAARVRQSGPPPIRSLATAFNTMTVRLQANDAQRRHLMADVAHELRTPLSVMQGRLEALLDGVYPRDDQHLADVLEETRLMSRLVEDLRTLALSESGALKLQKESTDLAILIHEGVRAFASEASAKGLTLRTDVPSDLPLIEIDPLRIREVLTNLLSNAIRHTPLDGRVSVIVSANPIRVSVSDTGTGIAPDELDHIFDRFYKGSQSRGSGLGLTIAKDLVAAHCGEINVASELGKGTTISFTLPQAE